MMATNILLKSVEYPNLQILEIPNITKLLDSLWLLNLRIAVAFSVIYACYPFCKGI